MKTEKEQKPFELVTSPVEIDLQLPTRPLRPLSIGMRDLLEQISRDSEYDATKDAFREVNLPDPGGHTALGDSIMKKTDGNINPTD